MILGVAGSIAPHDLNCARGQVRQRNVLFLTPSTGRLYLISFHFGFVCNSIEELTLVVLRSIWCT